MFSPPPYLCTCHVASHLGSIIVGSKSCEFNAKLGFYTESFQNMVIQEFLAMQILGPTPDLLNQKLSGWGPAICVQTSFP